MIVNSIKIELTEKVRMIDLFAGIGGFRASARTVRAIVRKQIIVEPRKRKDKIRAGYKCVACPLFLF